MLSELTAEEIVTDLLSSHQILKANHDTYALTHLDLNKYNNEFYNQTRDNSEKKYNKNSKYSFITKDFSF